MRVDISLKMLTSPTIHHPYAATENDHGDVGGGEYGLRGGIGVEGYYYQGKGGSDIDVRIDTSSICSLLPPYITLTQLLKMPMETSEEVSVRQDGE